jgi:hypothetical protein
MLPNVSQAEKRHPSRRKSCTECILAKRRCDKGLPKCARCSKQNLACQYHTPPVPTFTNNLSALDNSLTATGLGQTDIFEWPNVSSEITEPFDFTSSQGFTIGLLDNAPMEGILNHSANIVRLGQGLSSPSLLGFSSPDLSGSLRELSTFSASRLNYGINQLKLAPSRMILENGTPWSHPHLYDEQMPRSMQGVNFLFTI